jgi:dCMP deaminase
MYHNWMAPGKLEFEYMRQAYLLAQSSPDPRTQNGAVLVDPKTGYIVSVGVNTLPRFVHRKPERLESPEKYKWIEHAERYTIQNAARLGTKTDGTVLYCCWAACQDCARQIINAGVVEVVSHRLDLHNNVAHWEESISAAMQMFKEAGVGYREIDAKFDIDIMFNGEKVTV